MLRRFGLIASFLLVGCMQNAGTSAPPPSVPQKPVEAKATSSERGPSGAPKEELPWADFSPDTFAKAKAEKKYIVMDGSAEWCHWCHVMEATTYHDPEVRKLLEKHFIAVKVDIDSRPDLEERYGEYGWPATIMFAPDASEIGKYRGYIAPEKFTEILKEIVGSGIAERGIAAAQKPVVKAPKTPLAEEQLAWMAKMVDLDLDDYYDEDEGGWGRSQKASVGSDNEWTLFKAKTDEASKKKVLFTLEKQSALLDPVFGGIYQYSAARNWDSPHFEKLMTFQAPAVDNYARAYELTKDPKMLDRARGVQRYLDRFMKSAEGGFYTTQDADLNAHDRSKAFMDGHDYYKLDEKQRLAAGIPRVDTHEYAKDNGLAIAAYATLYEVTKDPAVLATAEKAAARIMATHAAKKGGYSHDAITPEKEAKQIFLGDNAAFGFGLMRLYEVTKKPEYLAKAKALVDVMTAELFDDDSGGFFGSSKDPDAVGVFATRRTPFEENVLAIRFFAKVARETKDAKYKVTIGRALRAVSDPAEIKGRGRWLGDYLLALEETKGVR